MSRYRAGLLAMIRVVALLTFALARPVIAQDAASARAVAEEHNQKGHEAVDGLRFRDAATEFVAAYAAYPDAKYLYNAGRAFHLAGEPGEAVGYYRRYLSEAVAAPDRAEVEAWISDCERLLGQMRAELTVTATPEGASVFIDGNPQKHVSPLKVLLAPGQHEIVVEAAGFTSSRRTVTLAAGRGQAIDVILVRVLATLLSVESPVAGASVFSDGRLLGRTPLRVADLAPGEHSLLVEAAGHDPLEQKVVLVAGETLSVNAVLAPSRASAQSGARVTRSGVLVRSALFAGTGQIHAGSAGAGWTFVAAEAAFLAGLAVGLAGRSYYLDRRDTEGDADKWRAYDDNAGTMKWIAIGSGAAAAAVWAASLVHASLIALPGEVAILPSPGGDASAIGAQAVLGF